MVCDDMQTVSGRARAVAMPTEFWRELLNE